MTSPITYFGIRHHGPGCASSLCKALKALKPDCILIEGPTGAKDLLSFVQNEALKPPVALLSYCVDDPSLSIFHPFALFSPEWQVILFAKQNNISVSFIDLSAATTIAQMKQKRDSLKEKIADEEHNKSAISEPEKECVNNQNMPIEHHVLDPLDWLAHAAGYNDGESWWNHMVEERGDGADLFQAITHAMTELRENTPERDKDYEMREAQREAHMRLEIRKAQKIGYERIAVVCGAWHVPALQREVKQSDDQKLIKGLPKVKTQSTWVPWTYHHLSRDSGYAAGITSPGWYEYLWHTNQNPDIYHGHRSVGWYVRIASLLRKHELDCSSAHLIEAARLAETLAAIRNRPTPSLYELNEAALSVICNGNEMPMQLIERELTIGHAIGHVPCNVPTVPLQKDVQSQQRSLRLKPEALEKDLNLDLRNENDLARSHLLHRLNLLGIDWGEPSHVRQKGKGTFHEHWRLSWQPQYEVDIIVASRYGHSVEAAASALCEERAAKTKHLSELTELMNKVLLANLPKAVQTITQTLEKRSVESADPIDLLNALPALANIHRYGNVRQTDAVQVIHLFDSILQRAVIALPLAIFYINADAAQSVRQTLLLTDRAITLRAGSEQTLLWHQALQYIVSVQSSAALLRGLCTRLLLDSQIIAHEEVLGELGLNLSTGSDAQNAAQWLDGFLNRNAAVLLHNDDLWSLIDEWLCSLHQEHFIAILPLIRRTFSEFEPADRRDLGTKAKNAPHKKAHKHSDKIQPENQWDEARVQRVLPTIAALLGLSFNIKE